MVVTRCHYLGSASNLVKIMQQIRPLLMPCAALNLSRRGVV